MKQNTLPRLCIFLAAVFISVPSHTEAKCNSCTEYNIACVNETSFNLCYGGERDTSTVFNCPSNKICSVSSLKCVDPTSGGKPACEPNKGCGICVDNEMFTCTSRTTFAQCNGGVLTNVTGVCPEGFTCNSQGAEICVDECNRPAVFECDRDTPL